VGLGWNPTSPSSWGCRNIGQAEKCSWGLPYLSESKMNLLFYFLSSLLQMVLLKSNHLP
jgi:hypothetical protein